MIPQLQTIKQSPYLIPPQVLNDCAAFLNSFRFDSVKLEPLPSGGISVLTSNFESVEFHKDMIIVFYDMETETVYNDVRDLLREYVPPCMTL